MVDDIRTAKMECENKVMNGGNCNQSFSEQKMTEPRVSESIMQKSLDYNSDVRK